VFLSAYVCLSVSVCVSVSQCVSLSQYSFSIQGTRKPEQVKLP